MSRRFWLVQRLARAYEGNTKTGFDHLFELEYMGSAEYEFRTPYESLQRMRSKPLIVFHHEIHSVKGVPIKNEAVHVFFVGHKDGLLDKIEDWELWLDEPDEKSKERTHFRENVTGLDWRGDPASSYYTRTVAWWSYSDDLAWTLDPDVAASLIKGFESS